VSQLDLQPANYRREHDVRVIRRKKSVAFSKRTEPNY
jgi:hypothetical protein